jgi:tetratricopeptide (TPR) repeat protein
MYFVGGRQTRQRNRLYRLLFGVDEHMRRWDLIFGLLFLALVLPHLMGGYTSHRYFERIIAKRPLLHETMHTPTLAALPVMREWKQDWSNKPALAVRVRRALRETRGLKRKDSATLFRMGELQLLDAFRARTHPRELFQYGPGDRIVFDRIKGAEAVASFNRVLQQPPEERGAWEPAALALIGFFHLSDHNYKDADAFFERALAQAADGKEAKFPRYQVVLLSAQTAMLSGDLAKAERLLEGILVDERLPKRAYPLAMGHFADAMRLGGHTERAPELLVKTLDMYKAQNNRAGIARVHLRLAALALEQGRVEDASRELSLAASLASGLQDGFTLNMVEGLSQSFPQVL